MKTKSEHVLSGPVAKVQDLLNSTLICHLLKCITEILYNERTRKI